MGDRGEERSTHTLTAFFNEFFAVIYLMAESFHDTCYAFHVWCVLYTCLVSHGASETEQQQLDGENITRDKDGERADEWRVCVCVSVYG